MQIDEIDKMIYRELEKDGRSTATVTFSGIDKSLSDDDINELGNALADLQDRPLSNLTRLDSAQLLNG